MRKRIISGLMMMVIVGWIVHLPLATGASEPINEGEFSVDLSKGAGNTDPGASATLENHKMALYPPPTCPTPPTTKTTFDPGDVVMNWNAIMNVTGGSTWRYDWYAPDQTNYVNTGTYSSSGNWCLSLRWTNGIPDKPGDWSVEFRFNGTKLYTDYFTVTGTTPSWGSTVYPSLFANKRGSLELLREYRDQVLASTPLGNTYVNRLYGRSHEVLLLLLSNPDLMKQARALLPFLLPEVKRATEGGMGYLPVEVLAEINVFLNNLAKEGTPELLNLIKNVMTDLESPETMEIFGFQVD